MNPKKDKLITEKEVLVQKITLTEEKIQKMKNRVEDLDAKIKAIVNSEYGAILECYNITPEELAELLEKMKVKGKDT